MQTTRFSSPKPDLRTNHTENALALYVLSPAFAVRSNGRISLQPCRKPEVPAGNPDLAFFKSGILTVIQYLQLIVLKKEFDVRNPIC